MCVFCVVSRVASFHSVDLTGMVLSCMWDFASLSNQQLVTRWQFAILWGITPLKLPKGATFSVWNVCKDAVKSITSTTANFR